MLGALAQTRFRQRLATLRGKGGAANRMTVEEYRRHEAKIRKMIADGKVSKEDAERRLGEMRRAMQSGKRGKGVKDGKTTRAEADALLRKLGYK